MDPRPCLAAFLVYIRYSTIVINPPVSVYFLPTQILTFDISTNSPYAMVPHFIGPPICHGTIFPRLTHIPRYHISLAHPYAMVPHFISPPIYHDTTLSQPTHMPWYHILSAYPSSMISHFISPPVYYGTTFPQPTHIPWYHTFLAHPYAMVSHLLGPPINPRNGPYTLFTTISIPDSIPYHSGACWPSAHPSPSGSCIVGPPITHGTCGTWAHSSHTGAHESLAHPYTTGDMHRLADNRLACLP